MSKTERFAISLFALLLVVVAAAPHYYRTRPEVRCSIPDRPYQFGAHSQPARTVSNVAVALPAGTIQASKSLPGFATTPSDPLAQQTIKSFQFVERPVLQIDHCIVSQLSVLLSDSGNWTVSLRADQNPVASERLNPVKVSTDEPHRRFTDHLLRNQFHIAVRCYAGRSTGIADRLLGSPFVIPLQVDPFWVQKQQPYHLFVSNYDARIRQYFSLIDRVEIEFVYREE